MAIKGKKKSQARGSHARRRPAAAPRPTVPARQAVPWYRTPRGQLIALVVGVLVLSLAVWAIAAWRSNAADLDSEREQLSGFTSEMRAALQLVKQPASEMSEAPTRSKGDVGSLDKDSSAWLAALTSAQQQLQVPRSGAVDDIGAVYAQAVNGYAGAARSYQLATEVDPALADQALARAGEQRDQAAALWTVATELLDAERAEVGLGPSRITAPAEGSSTIPAGGTGGG